MLSTRRRMGVAVVLVASLLLAGCTPPISYAWRLNDDGSVDFAFCGETRASQMEVRYVRDSTKVFVVSSAGREVEFGEGKVVSEPPAAWLAKPNPSRAPGDAWDLVEFEFVAEKLPAGTVLPEKGSILDDGPVIVLSREISRDELKVGQWIWDEAGGASCELVESLDHGAVYSGALNRAAFDELISQPSIDIAVASLTELGTVPRAIDFQNYLLEDLQVTFVAGMTLPEAFAAAFGPDSNPDLVFAPGIAVGLLGYVWDPTSISGNRWAQDAFPDAAAFNAPIAG